MTAEEERAARPKPDTGAQAKLRRAAAERRLAEALKENLLKRKRQARAREPDPSA